MTRKEAERIAGRVLEGLVSDLLDTFGDDGEDAETKAAPPTCKDYCGTEHPPGPTVGRSCVHVDGGNVCYCTEECAFAGRPLNPAAAPGKPSCSVCGGTGRVPWEASEDVPCPVIDCPSRAPAPLPKPEEPTK